MAISFGAIKGRTQHRNQSVFFLLSLSLSLLCTFSLSHFFAPLPWRRQGRTRASAGKSAAGRSGEPPRRRTIVRRRRTRASGSSRRRRRRRRDGSRSLSTHCGSSQAAPPESSRSRHASPLPLRHQFCVGMVVPCTDENHHSCKGFFDVACTIPEEEFAFRAEVGKGYMGSRTSKAPSSAQSLRNQLFREDSLPSIIPYGRQISQISTAPKFVTHFSRISERHQNGYMTPVRIGRSAMHRMSRSPYFGAIPATNIKVHKRGSSVLDNDLGCPGHIRRLRQKSDLRSPSKDIQRLHGKDKLDVLSDFDLQKPGSSISLKQGKIANTDESAGPFTSGVELNETVGAVNPITATDAKADLQKLGSSISLKQGKIANTDESAGPCTSGVELIQTVGSVNPITATDAKDGSRATDLVISGSVAVSSGRRLGFQMRAPEVDFDLDDDAEVGKAEEFDSQASTNTPALVAMNIHFFDAVARVSKKLRVKVGKANFGHMNH